MCSECEAYFTMNTTRLLGSASSECCQQNHKGCCVFYPSALASGAVDIKLLFCFVYAYFLKLRSFNVADFKSYEKPFNYIINQWGDLTLCKEREAHELKLVTVNHNNGGKSFILIPTYVNT